MAHQKNKNNRLLFRYRPAEPKTLRTMKERITMLHEKRGHKYYPARFLWKNNWYEIERIIRFWRDVYRNRWYWVKTDHGVYEVYCHSKVISLVRQEFERQWFITRQLDQKYFEWWRWVVRS